MLSFCKHEQLTFSPAVGQLDHQGRRGGARAPFLVSLGRMGGVGMPACHRRVRRISLTTHQVPHARVRPTLFPPYLMTCLGALAAAPGAATR